MSEASPVDFAEKENLPRKHRNAVFALKTHRVLALIFSRGFDSDMERLSTIGLMILPNVANPALISISRSHSRDRSQSLARQGCYLGLGD